MKLRTLSYETILWPAKGEFRISRSALSAFPVVQVSISEAGAIGRSECRPYARYNETPETVSAQIEDIRSEIEGGLSIEELQIRMPAGAARNALDCALWDLAAKKSGKPISELLDLPVPSARKTAFTLSIDTPSKMAAAAVDAAVFSILKVKIGGNDGITACEAILNARPDAQLIVDANEALTPNGLEKLCGISLAANIALVEQPYAAGTDLMGLFSEAGPKICADESLHTSQDLEKLRLAGYRAVNVKLDKTGGLTEALKTMRQARIMGFEVMAGCMVGSSLAMAPMTVLESFADYIDLDGPLLLSEDVPNPIKYNGEVLLPPGQALWG